MIDNKDGSSLYGRQQHDISQRDKESLKIPSQDRLDLQARQENDDAKSTTTINPTLTNSWRANTYKDNILQRDCSKDNRHQPSSNNIASNPAVVELRPSDSRLNISIPTTSTTVSSANENDLINIGDNNSEHVIKQLSVQDYTTKLVPENFSLSTLSQSTRIKSLSHNNPGDSKRVRFKSLLSSSLLPKVFLDQETTADEIVDTDDHVLNANNSTSNAGSSIDNHTLSSEIDDNISGLKEQQHEINSKERLCYNNFKKDDESYNCSFESENEEEDEEEDENEYENHHSKQTSSKRYYSPSSLSKFNDRDKIKRFTSFKTIPQQSFVRRILNSLTSPINSFSEVNQPYVAYEDKDLLTGASKYASGKRRHQSKGRTFRGSYRYSREGISMAIFKKVTNLIFQKSTCALFGAFLIHVTLGTVYTLSNINSYLTSYMRKHGSPDATYGGSMWISSSYAVGQGFSMVLGGYIEKRFSAQLSCIIGCALHSIAIMSTSWSVNHGPLAVLVTYGFMPGFGCGLAYMTPMSNGFGWFPNRKGLVAGVILAGFGIGTFIFNVAQTAFVNPDNLSPPSDASGYFTQQSILEKVPQLFIFIGSIYAAMQFVGCCLLFKPPDVNYRLVSNEKSDERPILVDNEMTMKRAIHTREFIVLFLVYGITTQGVLFVNSMIKEYGQLFIGNDMYLAWVGSMASIANSMGRLLWGLAIDRFSFTQCFTLITIIFASIMFVMPFEFVLSSKVLYLVGTLGIFGSFSGWMSTYPVHLSRVFGRTNSGMIYGLIFVSQSCGGVIMAFGTHYLIDHFNRFVPFFCVVFLEILGLTIYHLFYPK